MKFISLICPYCSGKINLFEDHKYGECLHCGHKVMLVNDEVKRDERSDSSYPVFESVRYFIETEDKKGGVTEYLEKFRDNPNDPHGWLLCGFIQTLGLDPFEYDTPKEVLRYTYVNDKKQIPAAFSSWKRAFSVLDNQYFLSDYCKVIGMVLASKNLMNMSTDPMSYLNDLKDSIESSIHKSQGLEYESVKVVISDDIEDKITQNIFYTAITRAKKNLKIYWSKESSKKVLSSFKQNDTNREVQFINQICNLHGQYRKIE